jgi:hypothetical protein
LRISPLLFFLYPNLYSKSPFLLSFSLSLKNPSQDLFQNPTIQPFNRRSEYTTALLVSSSSRLDTRLFNR